MFPYRITCNDCVWHRRNKTISNETAIRWKTIYFQLNLYWYASICNINIFLACFYTALLVFCCVNLYSNITYRTIKFRGWECDECVFTVYNLMFRLNYTHRILWKIDFFVWNWIEYKISSQLHWYAVYSIFKNKSKKNIFCKRWFSLNEWQNSTSVWHKYQRHNHNMSFWYWTFFYKACSAMTFSGKCFLLHPFYECNCLRFLAFDRF